jgi:hypothetical protein
VFEPRVVSWFTKVMKIRELAIDVMPKYDLQKMYLST